MASTPTKVPAATSPESIPVLAYYYIWFDDGSWDRAKADYPLLGPYSSDDADVMRQHVQWAREAGIDGFIVSWKSTETLNRRLEQLVQVAAEEEFKLAIIYESLNYLREPLAVERVNSDLAYFTERYAQHPVFAIFDRPMLIWSGIWEFSPPQVETVVEDNGEHLLLLASEKNVKGYQRLSHLVDGNAYYWSSVNPQTHDGYSEKLATMGEAVHDDGGIWVAPAAPGFDARLVGGDTVVQRRDGETLRTELSAAIQSQPDAIGLISWNEFSENTHLEPSRSHGHRYLEALAEILPTFPLSR